ncbi:hypothetical protein [Calidithermus chliarophilus]|uniref:hypothetical protein n=1 Tax=Calidithermus chliarophilus TaxID=52023 RepID=UPI0004811CEA|nr:hypothetical protein [Calidithermus chliarophilus]
MQALPHPDLPTQASEGSVLRARAMQGYLLELRSALEVYRPIPSIHLMVLNLEDWNARARNPYGFAFQRTSPSGGLFVFLPARYPERLLWRLREVLLPAAKQAGMPGKVEEFLDLNLGHEYAHAVAVAWGLRTRVRWVDEFLANYLWLLALSRTNPDFFHLARAWGRTLTHLTPSDPQLGSYERKKPGFADQLWFQGRFTTLAAELAEKHADQLLKGLLEAAPLKRSTVHKVLVGLEPGFKQWFAEFSPSKQKAALPDGQAVEWENLGQEG